MTYRVRCAARSNAAGALAVFVSLVGWTGCGGSSATVPEDLNVLLIVVDTLGAEHVGAYGGGARTPNIDRLARDGVRFDDAIATAPWTQPSIASLFTSLMPTRHGVVKLNSTLDEAPVTLAEAVREQGLRTHGVISHILMLPKHGYAQGFDTYDTRGARGHDELSSEVVSDAAIEWLDQVGDERFFLFAHYFDPHYLYRHHADYAHTEAYEGPVRPSMPIWELRDMRATLADDDIDYLVGLYHEEIAFTDHHIGRLLDRVEALGLDQNTLVVFTADHGEEFMGHGWIGHTRTLYDELVRVPLIVRLPGVLEPELVTSPVSLLDVAPTIVSLLGAPWPDAWEGRALWSADEVGHAAAYDGRFVFSEVSYGPKTKAQKKQAAEKQAHKTALILGNLKLIHDQLEERWEIYERDADPGEQNDLWKSMSIPMANRVAPLIERLEAFEEALANPARAADSVDAGEAELEELRKLGYLR